MPDPSGSEPNSRETSRTPLFLALLFVLAVVVVAFAYMQQSALKQAADVRATATPDGVTDQPARVELRQELLAQFRTPMLEDEGQVLTASLSPDTRLVAAAGDDGTPRIWDAESGDLLAELSGHADPVRVATFSPDGALLVTADDDGGAELWDGLTFKNLASVEANISAVRAAGFSPDGASMLTAGDDGLVRIWRISIEEPGDATLTAGLELESRNGRVTSAAFSPDGGQILAAGNDGLARLWDARTGASLADLDGHAAPINSATFSPDGGRVATAGSDGAVQIWDISTLPPGEPIVLNAYGGPLYQATFNPDGSLLVTVGCDEQRVPCQAASIRAWDAETGQLLIEWPIASAEITTASLSPDWNYLLTVAGDGLVQLTRIHLDAEAMPDGGDGRIIGD